MKKELVIARYNRSLEWTKNINSDVKITVYNKNKVTLQENEILIEPNVGRCVHTFFYHIVNRYDSLSDLTFFSQDYPFDHISNYIEVINDEKLLDKYLYKTSDGYYINNTERLYMECFDDGRPQHKYILLDIYKAWNTIFTNKKIPKTREYYFYKELKTVNNLFDSDEIKFVVKNFMIRFIPAGHYAVTKNKIYQKDINFYKKIVKYLESGDPAAPYEIERLLNFIYDKNIL